MFSKSFVFPCDCGLWIAKRSACFSSKRKKTDHEQNAKRMIFVQALSGKFQNVIKTIGNVLNKANRASTNPKPMKNHFEQIQIESNRDKHLTTFQTHLEIVQINFETYQKLPKRCNYCSTCFKQIQNCTRARKFKPFQTVFIFVKQCLFLLRPFHCVLCFSKLYSSLQCFSRTIFDLLFMF